MIITYKMIEKAIAAAEGAYVQGTFQKQHQMRAALLAILPDIVDQIATRVDSAMDTWTFTADARGLIASHIRSLAEDREDRTEEET